MKKRWKKYGKNMEKMKRERGRPCTLGVTFKNGAGELF
jgi:hypothetical protein